MAQSEVDVVGLVQCTSPFVRSQDLEIACQKMIGGFDSVFSVRRCHGLRWVEKDDGMMVSINYDTAVCSRYFVVSP